MENLATVLRYEGKYEEAKKFYEIVLEIKKSNYGRDHINTARTMENLSIIL